MGWEQLLAIQKEAVAEARAERDRPPQTCPDCGEPLEAGGSYWRP